MPATPVHQTQESMEHWQRQWQLQLAAAETAVRTKDEQIEHLLNQSERMAARLQEAHGVLTVLQTVENQHSELQIKFDQLSKVHANCVGAEAIESDRIEWQKHIDLLTLRVQQIESEKSELHRQNEQMQHSIQQTQANGNRNQYQHNFTQF
jgi:chromosome segregation ATPase